MAPSPWSGGLSKNDLFRAVPQNTVTPDTAAVQTAAISEMTATDVWGLQCQNGWSAMECGYSSPTYIEQPGGDNTGVSFNTIRQDSTKTTSLRVDYDHLLSANGCFADNEEKENAGQVILTCCRLSAP